MNKITTRGVFITGTDTAAGKTVFATALIHALRNRGIDAVGMKPVSAGCTRSNGQLRNEDAERLMAVSGTDNYELVNPCAYEPAIAPHIAAAQSDSPVDLDKISCAFSELAKRHEIVVVEGAGGWRVPLDENNDMSAIARRLGLPVLLVVGLRLGCLNHALLSADAIVADGCQLTGWVGSRVTSNFVCVDENIETLRIRIKAPCLGILPYCSATERGAAATLATLATLAKAIESGVIFQSATVLTTEDA